MKSLRNIAFSTLLCLLSTEMFVKSEADDMDGIEHNETVKPKVMVAILVRNKAFVLPWFFGHFENLNYPKDRMDIWIVSDHNVDTSAEMLEEWASSVQHLYHSVHLDIDKAITEYHDEDGPVHWSEKRFKTVIQLKQRAIDDARDMMADFIFILDADVILENTNTLSALVAADRPIIAPMLRTKEGDTYSNFWGGMNEHGYYKSVPEYYDILYRRETGIFAVPMVHSAILLNLNDEETYDVAYSPPPEGYEGPLDDIIIFAQSAKAAGAQMYVCNEEEFGSIMEPLEHPSTLRDAAAHFSFVKIAANNEGRELVKSAFVTELPPEPIDKMNMDEIFVISLKRRPERRKRVQWSMRELGFDITIVDAVDGGDINATYLKKMKIKMLPGYLDPNQNRPLNMGEIGCFLSHYFVWQEVKNKGYGQVLVCEDDVRFEPFVKKKIGELMQEVEKTVPKWDLIYLYRKKLRVDEESKIGTSESLVWPSYSYGTVSYILSNRGAEKLLKQDPLSKMIAVDEFLPIMYDKHPEKDWYTHFGPRSLVALSVEPLLAYQTHFSGDNGYISDTENSKLIIETLKHEL